MKPRLSAACALACLGLLTSASASAGAEPAAASGLRTLIDGADDSAVGEGPVVRLDGAVGGGQADPGDDLTCLTEAVYYEARSEGRAGQAAVAQVVINRTRRAGFPQTVCGVVYQRAGETSGCQFSFVCDGALDRPIEASAWRTASEIAARALAGHVDRDLLGVTHYHAAWMTPPWAYRLAPVRRIGGQVFYR